MSWLADLVEAVIDGVAKFSRKRPPEKPAAWNRPHFFNVDDICVYCGDRKTPVTLRTKCRGPAA